MEAEAPSGFEVFGITRCTKILQFSRLKTGGHVRYYQATHTSLHNTPDNQIEAKELKTNTAAPAWEQSRKDPMEQPLAGSCRVAAGWVYELLAAVRDVK